MIKRYSLKLGAGFIALVAMGAGCGHARAQAATPKVSGARTTGTQLAFELAMAQSGAPAAAKSLRTETVAGSDGLKKGVSYIEADQIESTEDGITTASGQVQMRLNGRTIRADTVRSDANTGVTRAQGHTQTINEDGSVQFAESITYDDNMQSGYSENFASIGRDNSKVFARRVEQVNPDINRLTNVIYTPCNLCRKDGVTQSPTWSIEAGKITQRKDKGMVYYNNALVKIKGVPVFYSPYLWTPDPERERASGFLFPKIGADKKRGVSYEQPYLWSISPYQYLIISPQLNSQVNPLLNLEYERNFYSGILHARLGATYDSFFNNLGDKSGTKAWRGYVLADGAFDINDDWRWSFTVQHVEDAAVNTGTNRDIGETYANFFERYGVDGAFDKVGDLSVDSRQLINQFNLTRQVSNGYFAINMASFQSMQAVFDTGDTKRLNPFAVSSDLFPVIAPQIEAYWSPKSRILGGQLTVSASAIGVYHDRLATRTVGLRAIDIGAPLASDGITGYDTTRASAGLTWQGDMTTASGVRFGPFVDLRHDYYKVSDLDASGLEGEDSRDLATAGLNISYPLYRRFNGVTAVVEPIAQLAVSPEAQVSPYIPTEDSQSFEFDETTLFSFNKSPGFDIYEAGSRASLGLRGELRYDSGLELEGLIGRVLRNEDETQFLQTVAINGRAYTIDPSGLGSRNSDWIATGSFKTKNGFNGYTRLRFDGDTSRLGQAEYGLSAIRKNTSLTVRYIVNNVLSPNLIRSYYNASDIDDSTEAGVVKAARLAQLATTGELKTFGDNYRNLQVYGRHFFTPHWGVSARLDRDMVNNTWRKSQVSLIYQDECSSFELVYQQNDTQLTNRNGKPSSSIFFRLNLTTLGTSPAKFNDVR